MSKQMELPEIAWYLLQCKPRQDTRACEHLTRQGFECFNPSIEMQTLKRGSIQQKVQPLFPGYIFVRVKAGDSWTSLQSTRGVTRLVAFCGTPCRVSDDIIAHLRERCAAAQNTQALNPGDRIHVKVGPYAELDAVFVSMDGEQRVMLLLNVLNRQQLVKVPLKHIST
ncbi:transcription/translation regulatory transformer protein RfaH [Pseudomonas sp. NyZ704]|nr:transcription/translation regulatory transformer protein RfaH [Pseudomonas sp. NyZ704]